MSIEPLDFAHHGPDRLPHYDGISSICLSHAAGRIPQQPSDLPGAHALSDQQKRV